MLLDESDCAVIAGLLGTREEQNDGVAERGALVDGACSFKQSRHSGAVIGRPGTIGCRVEVGHQHHGILSISPVHPGHDVLHVHDGRV